MQFYNLLFWLKAGLSNYIISWFIFYNQTAAITSTILLTILYLGLYLIYFANDKYADNYHSFEYNYLRDSFFYIVSLMSFMIFFPVMSYLTILLIGAAISIIAPIILIAIFD